MEEAPASRLQFYGQPASWHASRQGQRNQAGTESRTPAKPPDCSKIGVRAPLQSTNISQNSARSLNLQQTYTCKRYCTRDRVPRCNGSPVLTDLWTRFGAIVTPSQPPRDTKHLKTRGRRADGTSARRTYKSAAKRMQRNADGCNVARRLPCSRRQGGIVHWGHCETSGDSAESRPPQAFGWLRTQLDWDRLAPIEPHCPRQGTPASALVSPDRTPARPRVSHDQPRGKKNKS